MKILKSLFLLLLLSVASYGTAVRGTLVNTGGGPLTGGTLTLTLSSLDGNGNMVTGCAGGTAPNVRNSGTITSMTTVVTSGAGGALFGTVVGNDQINCGSGFGVGSFYHVVAKDATGTVAWTKDYNIVGATWTPASTNLNTLPPSILPVAILSNPGVNQTIVQPVGTSLTITGNVNISSLTATLIGNASTATALASTPTSCVANTFATAIDSHANLTCSGIAPAQLPNTIVYNNQTNTLTGITQFNNDIVISGSAGLPSGTTSLYLTGGFASPVSSRILFTDSTGWHLKLSGRANSTTSDQFTFLGTSSGGFFGVNLPLGLTGTPTTASLVAGGTLTTGVPVFYKVSAVGPDGGETDTLPEVTITPSGANLSVSLAWTAVPTAASYKIYRGTASNGENVFQTSVTNSFTDTGGAGTAGTPSAFNNSYMTKLRNTTGSYIYTGLSIGQTSSATYMLDLLGNTTVSATNLARFKSGTSASSFVMLDTTSTGVQALLQYAEAGTLKWVVGKGSTNSFVINDQVAAVDRISLTVSSNNTYSTGNPTGVHTFQHSDASLAAVNASQYQISGSQIAAANLSNGVTGSGAIVLATSPSLTTPALGAATGTSLNLGATGVLSTTAQSGTGSICMTTNCVMTTPNIGAATATTVTASGIVKSTAGGGGTSAGVQISAANAAFMIQNTGGTTDNKIWDVASSGTQLLFRAINDAQTVFGNYMTVNRSAGTITNVTFPSPVVIPNSLTLQTTSATLGALIQNDTAGGITLQANSGKAWTVNNTGVLGGCVGCPVFLQGATSGSITLQPAAVAGSSTLTLPAANDTLATLGLSQTFTGSNVFSGASTGFKRLRSNQGTAVVTGDFSISANWGTTASIASVSGTDTAGTISITSAGTGQTVNPSFTFTFHDGAFPSVPIVMATRGDVQTAGHIAVTSVSTTAAGFTVNHTPVAGQTYVFYWWTIAR